MKSIKKYLSGSLLDHLNISVLLLYLIQAEIKEMLSIVLRDLRFTSAVVHQVRSFYIVIIDADFNLFILSYCQFFHPKDLVRIC